MIDLVQQIECDDFDDFDEVFNDDLMHQICEIFFHNFLVDDLVEILEQEKEQIFEKILKLE